MCLAIAKPAGIRITKSKLYNGFEANRDGAGFAYVKNKAVHILKGFFTFKTFWKAYRDHENEACLIHFRWATHGTINEHNCHPWEILPKQLAMIHNGVLYQLGSKDKSDSGEMASLLREILTDKPSLIQNGGLKKLLESLIGSNNKLVFMDTDGHHTIINEKEGEWNEGSWFSNEGYKREPIYQTTPYHSTADDFHRDWWKYQNGINRWRKKYPEDVITSSDPVQKDTEEAKAYQAIEEQEVQEMMRHGISRTDALEHLRT